LGIGEISTDFAAKTPMVQARKQTRIPSVWTEEELKKLINAIARENPKGKRDYAIILLACRLGLRCTDIKNLRRENFHWGDKVLVLRQSKTKEPLTLPLTSEVGWAVIDYLKHGRPKFDSPFVFLRHLAPFGPFAEGDHLHQIIADYMKLAHLPMTITNVYHNFRRFPWRAGISHGGRGNGPRIHDFRHSYAVHCLKKWSGQGKDLTVFLPMLRTYMGHASFQDTAYYLRLTADVFPDITLKLEGMFAGIIPELAGDFHETQ
jgi:integrase